MPDVRSPWHHEPRARLSDQKIAKLFLERDGKCSQCGCKLRPGSDWIVEHRIALELGGTNDFDNLDLTCIACKPVKDASDHKAAGHIRRAAAKHYVSKSMRKRTALSKPKGMRYSWSERRYVRNEE